MYETTVREDVSQGDIFDGVEFIEAYERSPSERVIVLTHDCHYDKPKTRLILVALVRPFAQLDRSTQGYIRIGGVTFAQHLPHRPGSIEESMVDLRRIAPVPKEILEGAKGRRIVSLSDDGRAALQGKLHIFFSRAP